MTRTENAIRSERGQSLVEFALGFMIVAILLVAVADFGRAFFTYVALRDAAQEGAIYGSFCPRHVNNMYARARQSSTDPVDLQNTTNIVVTCHYIIDGVEQSTCTGAIQPGRDSLKIIVTFNNFEITTPLLGSILGSQTLPLRAEVIDTILRDIPASEQCPAQ
ncbi:MAG: pilus assembly protein [Chloroflexota bacterium]|nr:MAG: pilus assembly protein [Chloroflexota bacterium]